MQPFTIECTNLTLREFLPEDLDDFCAVTAQAHIRRFLPDWNVDRDTRRIWLRDYEIPPPNREIVYGISEECLGKGYMTQAVTALTDWLFANTQTTIIHGLAKLDNIASNRVLHKCGFDDHGEIELEDGLFKHYSRRK